MTTPRRRDASATRRALLEAGRKRFTRLGYERTTLRDIAADAGVNLALIKRYFGSKEGLLKAALEDQPRFGDEARDRTALADALAHQLSREAWPDFDEHPVLMLLRVSGDAQVDSLRRKALLDFSHKVLQATGAPADERLLEAQMVVALGVGIAVVRSAVGLQPLRDASAEELRAPLTAIVDALLPEVD
ncbi:TetR family transcriptional regulator [Dactylosporangium sp. CS-033363]|uniref:TetR/AcrR family transcriptional regulator n=1 Tax=Dactylosporangium sp. CS-033363 TaxID=3239935 RepID=UPI003D94255F